MHRRGFIGRGLALLAAALGIRQAAAPPLAFHRDAFALTMAPLDGIGFLAPGTKYTADEITPLMEQIDRACVERVYAPAAVGKGWVITSRSD
jgi:hypothetical protein